MLRTATGRRKRRALDQAWLARLAIQLRDSFSTGQNFVGHAMRKTLAIGQKLWHNQPLGQSKPRFDFAQWCEEGLPSG